MIDLVNKTVAVIGNSSSMFTQRHGEEIDSHDFVIRMNRAAQFYEFNPSWEKSHGLQTDMWCVWRYDELEVDDMVVTPYVMQMAFWHGKYKDVKGRYNKKKDLYFYPEEHVLELQRVSGIRTPSTGLMVLDWLAYQRANSVDVYGFDWKKTPTWTDTERNLQDRFQHDFNKEETYCKTILSFYNYK